jgi:tRNA(Ile)-lysidine synthase
VQLCRENGVPCEVGRATPGQWAAAGDGFEAAARQSRYEFLQDAAARLGARYVVTAHTADDQAETILHRILRGTGIAGLAGMARARPLGSAATLIRPFLEVRRAEVLEYLDQIGQAFRCDGTNEDRQFTRNRIRVELLPSLAAQYNPGVIDALLRLGRLAGEVQGVVDAIVDGMVEQAVVRGPQDQIRISLDPLEGQPRYVVRELLMAVWRQHQWPLQAMGFEQWDLLAEMATAGSQGIVPPPQKRMFPGGILAEVRGDGLWLGPTTRPQGGCPLQNKAKP